jgi:transcriptional regulator of acetoin/glycerol metabolism
VTPLPHAIFHGSPLQRVALARERFFEEGVLPTGLVSDAVIQSWNRCLRRHNDAREAVEFDPVSPSRAHHAQQRNRELVNAWNAELGPLQQALRSTGCAAILTDASGVLIAAMASGGAHERLMPIAHRVGVNLSEEAVGTTAPGIVARTGRACIVMGGEHFFEGVRTMHCAAAPICDIDGRLAGVLDISSEVQPFHFDAVALVALYAEALENRLLVAQSRELLLLRLQVHPDLLDAPRAGLVGIDEQGRVAWVNAVAAGLLGSHTIHSSKRSKLEEVLGLDHAAVSSLPREQARLVALPNGLSVWLLTLQPARDGRQRLFAIERAIAAGPSSACESNRETSSPIAEPPADLDEGDSMCLAAQTQTSAPDPSTLRQCSRDIITSALRDCGGSVSKAAKQLGVSRGLIYRRLRS